MSNNEYANDPAEENLGGSSGLGREAKIGVSVIVLLAIVFVVVVVVRLTGSGSDEKIATTTASHKAKKTASSDRKNGSLLKINRTKPADGVAPTIVSAKTSKTKAKTSGLDRWKFASDRTRTKLSGSRNTSLVPDPPKPPHPDRYDRYASNLPAGRQTDRTRQLRNMDNNTTTRRYVPNANHNDSTGYSLAEPTPPLPAYREHYRYGNSRASSPTMPVGQYDKRDFRRGSSSQGHYSGNSRRSASASLYGNPPPRRGDGKYEVQPNDSYWTISERLYGTGAYFKAIARHNRGMDNSDDQLQPGVLILAPEVAELEKSYPDLCPKPSRREALLSQSRSRTSTVSTRNQYRGGRTYTVVEGDTLFDIARYELGKASRWAEIYDLNRDVLGKDFHYLTPSTQLVMPGGEKSDVIAEPPSNRYRR